MKKILLSALLLLSAITFAQGPQGISYQAVAFTSGGNPVVNGTVGIRISILDNSATGTVVYSETHSKPTNAQGLFNLNIGQGTAVTGTFSAISWGVNTKFLKVEVDPAGGTSYSITGTNQLMSVPYALYAQNVGDNALAGIGTGALKSSSYAVIDNNKVHVFSNGAWYTQTATSEIYSSSIINSNGNFAVIDNNKVYGFSNGTWSTKVCSGEVYSSAIITSGGKFAIRDGSNVHIFYNGSWSTQTCSGEVYASDIIISEGNFIIIDQNNAHAFSNGTWATKTCSSEVYNSAVISSNGNFIIRDGNNVHGFNNGVWATKTCSSEVYNSAIINSVTN
ncbi:hypothetical protein HYN59_13435 [Flavobacterium album]|uniref:Bulb-type lectin domain-containing protein n=1 Tax=Flavobacterium album TaxID=2175091 RepID=A0A2S1R060_9FLAO|nr:hypothetical protein [Flavobacterium album]AWH86052.1 hypothetical protein HYN59_13435 [Flavobacterium album]